MKQKDTAVLMLLKTNSRKKLSQISKELHLPLTTTLLGYRRVQKYIKRNVSLLDFEKLQYPLQVFYFLRIKKETKDALHTLLEHPCINTALQADDGQGYCIEAVFKNAKTYHSFTQLLKDLKPLELDWHEVIEEIVREAFPNRPDQLH
ncbi:MAG: hypothetical protein QW594_02885 [Candidatus Woesearchaeota archaeon]